MKILTAASEMAPFAKTGGLGDVLGALPRQLAARGHEVHVALPFYRCVRDAAKQAEPTGIRLTVPLGQKQATGDLWQLRINPRLTLWLVRRDEYFDRSELYRLPERDYDDNAERFIFFSKTVISLNAALQLRPDILHAHDWQTALVPLYASLAEAAYGAAPVRTVFTIHNLAYQGIFSSAEFPLLNLPNSFFAPEALEFYGQLNLMKAGIIFSHAITTVSRKYAREIQTHEYGCGLDGVLRSRAHDLHGIVNGADYNEWNPETDPFLTRRFSARDLHGKAACKRDLLRQFGLRPNSEPLIGMVTRLTRQKGLDLFLDAAKELFSLDARWLVVGAGEKEEEDLLRTLANKHPQRLAVRIAFDTELAHKVIAGSDFFLMPSRFEPCGLNQMYAMRYATIPIVRATGGLDDTVESYLPETGKGNGFKFTDPTAAALAAVIRTALALYGHKTHWPQLRQNAMACDFSWSRAAGEYEKIYSLTDTSHA